MPSTGSMTQVRPLVPTWSAPSSPRSSRRGARAAGSLDDQPLGGVVGGRHDVGDVRLLLDLDAVAPHPGGQGAGGADQVGGELLVVHGVHATGSPSPLTGPADGQAAYGGRTGSPRPRQGSHMSDKSPRQGMSKKSGKSIKEKRAEKHAKAAGSAHPSRTQSAARRSDPPEPRRHRHVRQGERAPPPPPPRAPGAPRPGARRAAITLEHGYGERFGHSDADLAQHVAGLATREEILAGSRRGGAAQAPARGRGRDACRAGPVGLAALRPGRRADAARDRPGADPDRLRGDEPLDGRRRVGLHVFHKNNELAGYCSVLQAMELVGITGDYGRRLARW